jgi:hypothetical protein
MTQQYLASRKPLRSKIRGDWKFQFRASFKDARLIPPAERFLEVPMRKRRTDKGYIGQRNWFFPEQSDNYVSFLESFSLLQSRWRSVPQVRAENLSEFEEGQRFIAEIVVSMRNGALVREAKECTERVIG